MTADEACSTDDRDAGAYPSCQRHRYCFPLRVHVLEGRVRDEQMPHDRADAFGVWCDAGGHQGGHRLHGVCREV